MQTYRKENAKYYTYTVKGSYTFHILKGHSYASEVYYKAYTERLEFRWNPTPSSTCFSVSYSLSQSLHSPSFKLIYLALILS